MRGQEGYPDSAVRRAVRLLGGVQPAADKVGVAKNTVIRWLRAGGIAKWRDARDLAAASGIAEAELLVKPKARKPYTRRTSPDVVQP